MRRNAAGAAISVRNRDERTGPDEVEGREEAEAQCAQPADQNVILADTSGQDHADQIRRQHSFAVGPSRKRAEPEQKQQQVLGLKFGGAATI